MAEVDFTPTTLGLKLYANDTEPLLFRIWSDTNKTTPMNISGYSWKLTLRQSPSSTAAYTPTCTAHNTTGGADPSTVAVTIDMAALVTAVGDLSSGTWDLQSTHAVNGVQTWFKGTWTRTMDVSRP